jgi:hypothetical protein
MDWQGHLLGYLGQLFLHYWQTYFVGFCLGRGCWVGISTIASGLLNFRRYCALSLEGNSQVEIIPICVSVLGRAYNALLYHFCDCLRLLVLSGRHPACFVGSL